MCVDLSDTLQYTKQEIEYWRVTKKMSFLKLFKDFIT